MSHLFASSDTLSESDFSVPPDASVPSKFDEVNHQNGEGDPTLDDGFPFSSCNLEVNSLTGQIQGVVSGCPEPMNAMAVDVSSDQTQPRKNANAPKSVSKAAVAEDAVPLQSIPPNHVESGGPADDTVTGAAGAFTPIELVTSVKTKKRFNFMVAGGSGAGKSSFCYTAFVNLFPNFKMEKPDGTTETIGECGRGDMFDARSNEHIMATVIDTIGGFSRAGHIDPIVHYLETQHAEYERKELHRLPHLRAHEDTRIVCLFYFFDAHRVLDDDISFLASLNGTVNIVPIVSKADSQTDYELAKQLHLIRSRLREANIQFFDFCEEDINDDWVLEPTFADEKSFQKWRNEMAAANGAAHKTRPRVRNVFAVISNRREYAWTTLCEDDVRWSDTVRLHKALFGSLGRLADKMDEIHETWRNERDRQHWWRTVAAAMLLVVVGVAVAALNS